MPVVAKDWNAKLVDWINRNSYVTVMLFIGLVLSGVASLVTLQREGFPSPSTNLALISTLYPGAGPTEVEQQVVKPIEASLSGIAGVDTVQSMANNSIGVVSVSFKAGSDFKAGLAELRSKVQNVQLPSDANKPDITVPSFGGNLSFYAIAGDIEPGKLRAYGDAIRLDLEGVAGVKDFRLISEVKDQVTINWKSAAIAAAGVLPSDIQAALQGNNVTIPAGTVLFGEGVSAVDTSVVTLGSITSIDQLKELKVKNVKLSDLADISQTYAYKNLSNTVGYKDVKDQAGVLNVKNALLYELSFEDGVDVVRASEEVQKVLDKNITKLEAADLKLVTLSDVAEAVNKQIEEISEGAIGGPIGDGPVANLGYILGGVWLITLAMLTMVSWRAALISAIAIPLSLLFTFLSLKVQGITLNTLTLFSMVLALGLLVDPAIVVLEAIQRELDLGKRGRDAVIAAMNTVGSGVFMAVLTSIIVFVPFGVVSGVFGQIIRYIPITIIPALLASYFIPVLFLTFLAQRYLRPSKVVIDEENPENLWAFARWFIRTNTAILKRPVLQVIIVVLAVIVPIGVAGAMFATKQVVPVQFSAPNDAESMTVKIEYPANLDKAQKLKLVDQVETVLAEETEVQRYFTQLEDDHSLTISAFFLDRSLRSSDSPELIESSIKPKMDKIQDPEHKIFVTAAAQNLGTPQSEFPVAINIYGDSLDSLKRAAIQTGDILRKQPKVTRVEDGFTGNNNEQVQIILDRTKLNALGIPAVQVAGTMAALIGSSEVTKYEQEIDGQSRKVEVLLSNADKPASIEEISNTILMVTPAGVLRLKDVATVTESNGFSGIQRMNGSRFVTVQAKVEDALLDAAAPQQAVRDYWTKDKLAEFGLREDALEGKGAGDEFIKSFQDLFIALGVAVLLLYVVLVLFFKSFSQPFVILFAVPLTFIGVFPGVALVGGQFGFLEILGVITLSGIVVNVGIFLMDLANQKRAEGMHHKEAIALASGIRLRPILLTKVTALAGLAPLMILSPFWRSLATVVVAGVLVSGFLSLFTTPVLYSWFVGGKERIVKGFATRRAMRSTRKSA